MKWFGSEGDYNVLGKLLFEGAGTGQYYGGNNYVHDMEFRARGYYYGYNTETDNILFNDSML